MAIRANAGLISDKMMGNPSVKEKIETEEEIKAPKAPTKDLEK